MFKRLKISQKGFAHLQLIIVAAVVIVGIGAVGAYVISKSKAEGACTVTQYNPVITSKTANTVTVKWSFSSGSSVKYTQLVVSTSALISSPYYQKTTSHSTSFSRTFKRISYSYPAKSQFKSECNGSGNWDAFSATKSVQIPAR